MANAARPTGTLMANSQGQVDTDRMPEATVGPTAEQVAATSAFSARPRPSMERGYT